jgi:VanZ family protein
MTAHRLTAGRLVSLLAPPLFVMAGIFYLSSQTSTADHSTFELILRKLGHVTEYTVLALCWIRAMRGLGIGGGVKGAIFAGVGLTLAYAALDEFHQTFVGGRHGTPVDVLIDSIGMVIATLLVLRSARLRPAPEPRPLAPEGRVGERLEGVRQAR